MESFYVTSTHLDIDMATEPHPSGLVIFSRELSINGEPAGHIINISREPSYRYITQVRQYAKLSRPTNSLYE